MSNVNQAFLRAYVKNRAASIAAEEATVQPQPAALKQSTANEGMKANDGLRVRVDARHQTAQPAVTEQPNKVQTVVAKPTHVPVAPVAARSATSVPIRTGVWSQLGVERGIKATSEGYSVPAVVRNGVPPVSQNPVARQKPPAPPKPKTQPKSSVPMLADEVIDHRALYQRIDPGLAREVPQNHLAAANPRALDKSKPVAAPALAPFVPSWEVDEFFWPEVIRKLEESNTDAFRQIGKHLNLANRDGLRVMAVTSGERGVGRSTVALHMARSAAATGLKVAVVDADTYCPSLIDQLRLDIEHGWQDYLFENVPLEEVSVHSLADRITLFPLTSAISQSQVQANLLRMTKLIRRISTSFDMVFIDASRLNLEQRDLIGVSKDSVVDAAIVVVDTELSIKEKVDTAVSILQSMGLSSIGLVENFQAR